MIKVFKSQLVERPGSSNPSADRGRSVGDRHWRGWPWMALVEVLDGFLPLVVGLVVMERGVGVVMGVWMPVVVERWVEGATIGEVRVTHP